MMGKDDGNRRRQTISGILGDRRGASTSPGPADRGPEPAPQPSVIIDQRLAEPPANKSAPDGRRERNGQ